MKVYSLQYIKSNLVVIYPIGVDTPTHLTSCFEIRVSARVLECSNKLTKKVEEEFKFVS